MLPSLASLYTSNQSLTDAMLDSKFTKGCGVICAQCQYSSFGEFCRRMTLSSGGGSVYDFIGLVLHRRFPIQMLWVDTPRVAFAAAMSCFVDMRRWWAVSVFTHDATDKFPLTAAEHKSIPSGGHGIWPYQALITGVIFMRFDPRRWLAFCSTNAKWAATPYKSRVVCSAKSLCQVLLATASDFAYVCGGRRFHAPLYTIP